MIMATQSKSRRNRNRAPITRRKRPRLNAPAKRVDSREYCLPDGLIAAIEADREALELVLTLLTSVDATLEQREDGGGDVLDADDSADAQVLKARVLARPLDLVRLAIQRVYQVHSDLDSYNLGRAARGASVPR
jgi:hypothetical protein